MKESAFNVYKDKLMAKANSLGLKDVDELKEAFKEDLSKRKAEFNSVDPLKELENFEREKVDAAKRNKDHTIKVRSPRAKEAEKKPYKTLDSYVDVEKIRELPEKDISFIWRARFENKSRNLHASLSGPQFSSLYANAFRYPTFILPLPRGNEGYEMHFLQWSFVGRETTHCLLTTVAEYRLHGEFARPHTTLSFHQDLLDSKDIVLMSGTVEKDSNCSVEDAQVLLFNIQKFYGDVLNASEKREMVNLLEGFKHGDANFDLQKLIELSNKVE